MIVPWVSARDGPTLAAVASQRLLAFGPMVGTACQARSCGGLTAMPLARLEGKLEIFWAEAGPAGGSGEHAGPQFLVIMKREDEVGPALPSKRAVRAGLSLDLPADSQEGRENAPSLG
jgi:hypothetical protein